MPKERFDDVDFEQFKLKPRPTVPVGHGLKVPYEYRVWPRQIDCNDKPINLTETQWMTLKSLGAFSDDMDLVRSDKLAALASSIEEAIPAFAAIARMLREKRGISVDKFQAKME